MSGGHHLRQPSRTLHLHAAGGRGSGADHSGPPPIPGPECPSLAGPAARVGGRWTVSVGRTRPSSRCTVTTTRRS